MSPLDHELKQRLAQLGPEEKRQLLEYARSLGSKRPRGAPGAALLRFVGSIPKKDLQQIREAIENDREQVDSDER